MIPSREFIQATQLTLLVRTPERDWWDKCSFSVAHASSLIIAQPLQLISLDVNEPQLKVCNQITTKECWSLTVIITRVSAEPTQRLVEMVTTHVLASYHGNQTCLCHVLVEAAPYVISQSVSVFPIQILFSVIGNFIDEFFNFLIICIFYKSCHVSPIHLSIYVHPNRLAITLSLLLVCFWSQLQ